MLARALQPTSSSCMHPITSPLSSCWSAQIGTLAARPAGARAASAARAGGSRTAAAAAGCHAVSQRRGTACGAPATTRAAAAPAVAGTACARAVSACGRGSGEDSAGRAPFVLLLTCLDTFSPSARAAGAPASLCRWLVWPRASDLCKMNNEPYEWRAGSPSCRAMRAARGPERRGSQGGASWACFAPLGGAGCPRSIAQALAVPLTLR